MIIGSNKELFKTDLIKQQTAFSMKKIDTTKLYQEVIADLR